MDENKLPPILSTEDKQRIVDVMRSGGEEDLAGESDVIEYFEQGAFAATMLAMTLKGLVRPLINEDGELAFTLTEEGHTAADEIASLLQRADIMIEPKRQTIN